MAADEFIEVCGGGGLMHFMSRDEFERVDLILATRLDELKKRLDFLKSIDMSAPNATPRRFEDAACLNEFHAELERLDVEAASNLRLIQEWFRKEKKEIEEQYMNEYSRYAIGHINI